MTSIVTNISANNALQTLRSINSNLGETQKQVSTGLRVGKAADNAAYWSIATTMRSDNKSISAVQDALGLSGAILDTTYEAIVEPPRPFGHTDLNSIARSRTRTRRPWSTSRCHRRSSSSR